MDDKQPTFAGARASVLALSTDELRAEITARRKASKSIGCNVCDEPLPDAEPHVCTPRARFEVTEEQWGPLWQVISDVRNSRGRSPHDVDSGILLDALLDSDAFQALIESVRAEGKSERDTLVSDLYTAARMHSEWQERAEAAETLAREAWTQGFYAAQAYVPGWGPDPDILNPYAREASA